MTPVPFNLKWGIMATGGIAEMFTTDLLCAPSSRSVDDISHQLVAVASSGSAEKCDRFLKAIKAPNPDSVKKYASYAQLVADADVEIVYVATPHSHHFQNCMLALEAGKHVLCEKALTVNVAQARKLFETAKAKNLFFMEAVWTRFFPLSIKVRELLAAGEIGDVYRTIADLSSNDHAENGKDLKFADNHRMVDLNLAGGAILDLGVYPLTWLFQTLYHIQPESIKESPRVVASSNLYRTGADDNTVIVCQFPGHRTMGVATTSMRVDTDPVGQCSNANPSVRIQGSRGEIQVMGTAYQPSQIKIIKNKAVQVLDFPIPSDPAREDRGRGMFWEADECARCLRDGKLESGGMPWQESVAVMEVMEEALRQGGVAYPALITTDVYDAKSPLNVGNQ
ncbi:Trans-1 [Escovopsis weberi]|uniref:D-xylose 1-dehydrogenase (NADP(+), D-xylono-1,5-lactone-forming) n=1 Tax=Escovopsis weberi TaxID=150374 RepID=A0A0M8NAA8_ESCWE|nr:Trans-1 [Escovopsis weberi]